MNQADEKLLPAGDPPLLLEAPGAKKAPPKAHSRWRWLLIGGGILLLLLALLLFGFLRHRSEQKAAEAAAKKQRESIPQVNVARVIRSAANSRMQLPGNITPLTEAYLYARASGYVKRRYADIGDRVREGQVLADIEAPDLDQQVEQARAALAASEQQLTQTQGALRDANSRMELARVTWERYRVLESHGAVSRQEADQQSQAYKSAQAVVTEAQANIRAAEQNIQGNKANLARMIALRSFEQVRAPFSGVITARNFDVGALVSGGGGTQGSSSTPMGGTQQTSAQAVAGPGGSSQASISSTSPAAGAQGGELFRMAQIDVLRVLINVPEVVAPTIRLGEAGSVTVPAFPNRPFAGKITRTSSSVDIVSRTMLTEVQIPNTDRVLLPGMYVEVQLSSVRGTPPLLIPGDALIANADGLQVAVLQPLPDPPPQASQQDGQKKAPPQRIHLQKVQVGRDYGPSLEVTAGLEDGQYVVTNPSDVVREGATVEARVAPQSPGQNTQQTPVIGGEQTGRIGQPGQQSPTRGAPKGGGKK